MDDTQDSGQGELSGDVMESVGVTQDEPQETEAKDAQSKDENDPLYVQKRLKRQERRHEKEVRELHSKIDAMSAQMSNNQSMPQENSYQPPNSGGGTDDAIQRAVAYALNHQKMEEQKVENAKKAAHVHQQYGELENHLDKMADKYDDFDDAVRGKNVPITAHMRDASLFLPKTGPGSAGEVLYKLAKNPDELARIKELHPLDQAAEMVKLSHALVSGGESKSAAPRPLGQVKANPVVNSAGVNDKTPVSSIRERMRNGNWK